MRSIAPWSRRLVGPLALAVLLAGCQAAPDSEAEAPPAEAKRLEATADGLSAIASERSRNAAPAAAKPAAPQAVGGAAAAPTSASAPAANRYLIRRAELAVEVASVRESLRQLQAWVSAQGGFVSDSTLQAQTGEPVSAQVTLRVPSARFDAVLERLGGLGQLTSRAISSEDVSAEFVDTQSRIRNLQREEATLLTLLQRTGALRDVLEIERELSRVRGEIEQAQGRLRQLGQLVDLATIQLSINERVSVATPSPWQLGSAWQNAWQSAQRELAGTLGGLLGGGAWLLAYGLPLGLPLLALYLGLGYGLSRWIVGRGWLSAGRFRLVWGAVGVAALGALYPAVWLALGGVLLALALLAGGLALARRFGFTGAEGR